MSNVAEPAATATALAASLARITEGEASCVGPGRGAGHPGLDALQRLRLEDKAFTEHPHDEEPRP